MRKDIGKRRILQITSCNQNRSLIVSRIAWGNPGKLSQEGIYAMKKKNKYILFALPSFITMACIMLFPVAYAFYYSFFSYRMGREKYFVGLDNYINLLQSPDFWYSMRFSAVFTVIAVSLQFLLGLCIALLLDNIIRGKKILSVMIYLPYFITAAAAGVIFRWMFMSEWGIVSQLFTQFNIIPPNWFDSPFWSRFIVILAEVWQNTPFAVIVLYAGLQSIPQEQIEASRIDGASSFNVFRNVKLPNLRHLILLIFMMRTMDAWRLFDRISVMTAGGPGSATETLLLFNYRISFKMLRIGEGSAIGVLTLISLCIPIFLLMRAMRSSEVD